MLVLQCSFVRAVRSAGSLRLFFAGEIATKRVSVAPYSVLIVVATATTLNKVWQTSSEVITLVVECIF